MTAPRIIGTGVEGGTSLSGVSLASDIAGGGLVAVDYTEIQISNTNQSRMRALNRLAVALTGGIRPVVVPLMTDFIAPVLISNSSDVLTPFSDRSPFSDTSELFNPPVSGKVSGAKSASGATISVSVIGGTGILEGGEWFGLNHPTSGFRAYCVTDIDSVTGDGHGNNLYTVGIRPTLRDQIADGASVDWWRPRCTMRLAPGFAPDIDVSMFWYATPSLKFVEAF